MHTHIKTSFDGRPLRRVKVCSSHGALCSGDIPAAPLPSELPQLHQRRLSRTWRGGKNKKRGEEKKDEGELCFSNHIPMGFQLRRWGRSKQFCLSCLCFVALSFRGLFCFKLLFFRWGIEEWLMHIPSLFTPHSHPSLFCFGKIPPW